ncbi:MAG: VOC family protein [Bacteroidota bacterium]
MPTTLSAPSALVFYVRDIERTAAFYSTSLGLDVQRMPGEQGTFLMAETETVHLVFLPSEEPAGRSPIVVFGVEADIEAVVEQLAAQGVEIVTPVRHAPDGGLTADFKDPDGHVLSLYQDPE